MSDFPPYQSPNPTTPAPPIPPAQPANNDSIFKSYPREQPKVKRWFYASPGLLVLLFFAKFAIRSIAADEHNTPRRTAGVSEDSREGRDTSRHEIFLMIKDAKADHPDSYNLKITPTTNLSKCYKDHLVNRILNDKNLDRTLSAIDLDVLMGVQNTTPEGLERSFKAAKAYDDAVLSYCSRDRRDVVKFESAWKAGMHLPDTGGDKLDGLAKNVVKRYKTASNKRFKILYFVKKNSPKSHDGELVFASNSQQTYQRLINEYILATDSFEHLARDLEKKSDVYVTELLKKLEDKGPSPQ